MGGGPRDNDPHEPKPLLKHSLKAFVKASKALFKLTGSNSTLQLMRAHR